MGVVDADLFCFAASGPHSSTQQVARCRESVRPNTGGVAAGGRFFVGVGIVGSELLRPCFTGVWGADADGPRTERVLRLRPGRAGRAAWPPVLWLRGVLSLSGFAPFDFGFTFVLLFARLAAGLARGVVGPCIT